MVRQTLLGRIAIAVNANFDRFRRETRSAGRSSRQMARDLARARQEAAKTRREFGRFESGLGRIGGLAGAAFVGLGAAEATRGFLTYDRELTKVNTLVGVSREQLRAWNDDIVAISRETGVPMEQLAQGLFNIVSIGQTGNQVIESLRVIAKATSVGLGDFATVADTVTRIMSAYADENLKAASASDVVFATIKKGNDEGANFVKVFQEVIKRSQLAGTSAQEFGAALAFLTTEGFTANRAGLGLNETFRILFRQTKLVKKELADLGIPEKEFVRLFRTYGLIEGLARLRPRLQAVGRDLQNVFITSEAAAATSALANNLGKARAFLRELEVEAVGASERGFVGRVESVSGAFDIAVNDIRVGLTQIGEGILPTIADNLQKLIPIVGALGAAFLAIPIFAFARGTFAGLKLLGRGYGALRKQSAATSAAIKRGQEAAAKATKDATKEVQDQARAYQQYADEAVEELARTRGEIGKTAAKFASVGVGGALAYDALSDSFEGTASDAADFVVVADELDRVLRRIASLEEETRTTSFGFFGGLKDELREARAEADALKAAFGGFVSEGLGDIDLVEGRLANARAELENYLDLQGRDFGLFDRSLFTDIESLEQAEKAVEDLEIRLDALINFGEQHGSQIGELQVRLKDLTNEMIRLQSEGFDAARTPGSSPWDLQEVQGQVFETRERIKDLILLTEDLPPTVNPVAAMFADLAPNIGKAVVETEKLVKVFAPLRQSATEGILRDLSRQVDQARLSLGQVGADDERIERETDYLRFRQRVEDNLLRLQQEEERVNRRIEVIKNSTGAAQERQLKEQALTLDLIKEERQEYMNLLDVETELGAQAYELISTKAAINSQTQRQGEQEEEINSILESRLDIERDFINARRSGLRAGRDLVERAEDELEMARLRNRLTGSDPSDIAAEVAILRARQDLERDQLDLQRQVGRLQEEIRIAERLGNDEAIKGLQFRLATIHLEIEALEDREVALERYADIQRRIGEVSRRFDEEEDQIDEFMQNIRSSVEGSVEGIITSTSSLRDGLHGVIDAIISEFLRLAVVKPIIDFIFGGGFGGGGGVQLTGSASINAGAPGFRRQGGLARGFNIVGEDGPELIDFRHASRVYSNDDLANAIGSGGRSVVVHQNYNIQSTDGPGVRRAIERERPQFIADAVSAIEGLASRGNSRLSQALRT